MDIIDKGEIVFCNIEINYKEDLKIKNIKLNRVVFSRDYISNYPILDKNNFITSKIKRNGIISDIKVIDLIVIVRTGFKHNIKGYTKAAKNNEGRNKISGVYE